MARELTGGSAAAVDAAYTVVARRYRPQRFEDVVGQDHVVGALKNAINAGKIAQAYLFSGTRGVGKTSIARIFAKCLNCVHGPTTEPDQTCDICRSIAVGQDVDVIEIDGASNNGVDAVRELRQNAGLRPSRARYKIYYIDEVHMLSTGAFNALLKTLEEPPAHVKFLFATTEPNKIPVTVLSRCQRFDFAGIGAAQIVQTLADICKTEGVDADLGALQAVARRAGGSMRDAQSLLERLLTSGGRLTAERVHALLGTAPDDRVLDVLGAVVGGDLAGVLTHVESAVAAGVQPADLMGGAMEFLRDALVLKAGAGVALLSAAPESVGRLKGLVEGWPIDSVLAAQQVLDVARGRLRGGVSPRQVVEFALCRAARLGDLIEVSALVARLSALEGGEPAGPVKKKLAATEPASPAPPPPRPVGPLDLAGALAVWPSLMEALGPPLSSHLDKLRPTAVEPPGTVVVAVPTMYNYAADSCERPEALARVEANLRRLCPSASLRFAREVAPPRAEEPRRASRDAELAADPLVAEVARLFEARPVLVEAEESPES